MFSWGALSDFTSKAQQSLKDLGDKISEQAANAIDNVAESAQVLTNEAADSVTAFVSEAQTTYQQTSTQQEIEKMKRQKLERQMEEGCSPWEFQMDSAQEYDEQIAQELEERIRKLSEDENNFLMAAPTSSNVFEFDMDAALPYALCTLQVDSKLNALRYKLVPSRIDEDQFWKNYFYRAQVIRESMGVPKLPLTNNEVFDEEMISRSQEPGAGGSSSSVGIEKGDVTGEVSDVESARSGGSRDDGDRREGTHLSNSTNESAPSSWVDVQEEHANDQLLDVEEDDLLASDELNVGNLSAEARAQMESELGIGDVGLGDDVDLDNLDLDNVLGDDDIPDITDAELERELSGGALP